MKSAIQFPKLCKTLEYLIDHWGPIQGRTRLQKLVYLADQVWAQRHGKPYTEAVYYRWNHGPYSREFLKALEWMDGVELLEDSENIGEGTPYRYSPGLSTRLRTIELDPAFVAVLEEVGQVWRSRPLRELLDHVYADEGFKSREFGEHLF